MHSTHFQVDWINSTIVTYNDILPNLVELAIELGHVATINGILMD
jgi:hypothetical protein